MFFIQPTIESADTPEAEILDQEVVDTMGDDMLKVMEWGNSKIYDEYDSSCW